MNTPPGEASRALRRAMTLSATEPAQALAEPDAGLARARAGSDIEGLSSLARHAAVLCVQMGDARRALRYYDEVQRFDSEEPYLYVAIGNLRRQLGEVDAARTAFSRVLKLGRDQNKADLVTVAQDVLDQLKHS